MRMAESLDGDFLAWDPGVGYYGVRRYCSGICAWSLRGVEKGVELERTSVAGKAA